MTQAKIERNNILKVDIQTKLRNIMSRIQIEGGGVPLDTFRDSNYESNLRELDSVLYYSYWEKVENDEAREFSMP